MAPRKKRNAKTGDAINAPDQAQQPTIRSVMPADMQLIQDWSAVSSRLTLLKEQERQLREQLFAALFPNPVEGANYVQLPSGYKLRADYAFNRTVAVPVEELPAALAWTGLPRAKCKRLLVKDDTPKLALAEYRELSLEQQQKFDALLTVKPSLPSLKILPPDHSDDDAGYAHSDMSPVAAGHHHYSSQVQPAVTSPFGAPPRFDANGDVIS